MGTMNDDEGRAVLWAANRLPQMKLAIAPAAAEIARDRLPDSRVTISWQQAAPGASYEITLRRWDGDTTSLGGGPCTGRQGKRRSPCRCSPPAIPHRCHRCGKRRRDRMGHRPLQGHLARQHRIARPRVEPEQEEGASTRWSWRTPWAEVGLHASFFGRGVQRKTRLPRHPMTRSSSCTKGFRWPRDGPRRSGKLRRNRRA